MPKPRLPFAVSVTSSGNQRTVRVTFKKFSHLPAPQVHVLVRILGRFRNGDADDWLTETPPTTQALGDLPKDSPDHFYEVTFTPDNRFHYSVVVHAWDKTAPPGGDHRNDFDSGAVLLKF